jgi:peptidoglycan/xylan/chitin deacetylase (PgdA/CDA1 family)
MLTSFIYHDVLEDSRRDESGFGGAAASLYKLDTALFEMHLAALLTSTSGQFMQVFDPASLCAAATGRERRLLLTFDDGGASAVHPTADILEAHGLRGLFFIATDYIGTKTFLNHDDVRALYRRGHGIGTHSASHPLRMAALTAAELHSEWQISIEKIADLLGHAVTVASVPGGYYARNVADAARRCGIRVLFTSEPVSRVELVQDCHVLGRYAVRRTTSPKSIRMLASGNVAAKFRQRFVWAAKKALKRLGGRSWLALRAKYYETGSSR